MKPPPMPPIVPKEEPGPLWLCLIVWIFLFVLMSPLIARGFLIWLKAWKDILQ